MTRSHRIMDAISRVLAASGVVRWDGMANNPARYSHQGTVSRSHVRRLNVLAALVGIVLSFPLMVVIALAVRLTSTGPVLFRQERVGLDRRARKADRGSANVRREYDAGGTIFTMYKFRTMTTCMEEGVTREVWASPDDSRITPVGSFLRAYRLDELPQLFNVLRGNMNVVGPRPEQPSIFQELKSQIERYPERQVVLPGITGWAQVNHGYDQSMDDVRKKVALDLEYIRRRSPGEDLRIMALTFPVMIGRRGAL